LVAHEIGHLRGHVHVRDARFGRLQVFRLNGQVDNRILQTVLQGAKGRADLVLGNNGLVDGVKRQLRRLLGGDGEAVATR